MRKVLPIFLTVLMYTCLLVFSASGQEYQDFLSDWFEIFPGLSDPTNTGLTVFPVLEISPGGERSNLGNAYTAVSRDISFFESNPAASALLERTELAFLHRNLISDVSMDSVMYSQRFGRRDRMGLGFAGKFLHFEFTSVDGRGNQLASANPTEMLIAGNFSGVLGNNLFAWSGLALGINIKLAYRNIPFRLYDLDYINLPEYSQNLFGYMADVGLLTRFNLLKGYSGRDKNFSVGLAGKNLGPPVKGEALPSELSLGIAYRPLRPVMISADINYLMNFAEFSKSEGLGFATGLDVRFVNFFSLQTGFELRGSNPRFSLGADIELEPVSFIVSYTLDLTTASNRLDNFSVTAKLDFGDQGRQELRAQVDELYIQALIALSNNEYERVIELCDRILDEQDGLDPYFTPARQTRVLALVSLQTEQDFASFSETTEGLATDQEPTGEPETEAQD
mgnify:CR=1 FL=1|jgi:hypothetical protein